MKDTVAVPTVLLPFLITFLGATITWGGAMAKAENIETDVKGLESTVQELSRNGLEAHKGIALNEQAINQIMESLSRQHATQKESDNKLQTLIEIMLTSQNPR
jgi:hypothetical protein|tara:strand:+ start:51 stop:359 length:309 start_codon:yes stop_codon:yes gene_type:complete